MRHEPLEPGNPGMIVFGEDWGRHPSSTQHIVQRLAADRDVIWVNSLGLRRPRLDQRDLARLAGKAASLVRRGQGCKADGETLRHPFKAIVNPHFLPLPGSRTAALINRRLLARQIGGVAMANGLKKPLLWASLPTALPVVGALDERAVVYYAGDDFAALAGVDHGPVLKAERKLAQMASLILAASSEIAARFDPARTVVLPHGVDYERFATPAPRTPEMPTGKVAGFYGSINDWIDIPSLAAAALALPDWTFVLIGRIETDVTPLTGLANILFRPAMPHAGLPRWSQHWDVSLLPFRRNRQIDASNPLKLREYLAAGRPVAATYRFPAIDAIGAPVATPLPGQPLAAAILSAQGMGGEVVAWRPRLAQETWEARASTVAGLLAGL